MKYQHKTTHEVREFVEGMKIHKSWVSVSEFKTETGSVELAEVSPRSIKTKRTKKQLEAENGDDKSS